MIEKPLPEEEDPPYSEPPPTGNGFRSVVRWIIILSALTMVFSGVCWVAEYSGKPTGIPYVPIGIAGLIIYNLARLPAYLKLLLPKREETGEKFHRK
jgi:hypothetical protein